MPRLAERSIQTGLLGHAVDSAPAAFFVLDESGRFVAANRYACAMLGYEREELLELSIDDVELSPTLFRHRDGSTVLVRYKARPAEAGPVRLLVLVAYPTGLLAGKPAARTSRSPNGCELTGRELEVLQLMAEGLENDAISTELFISRETVKTHVRRLLQKLDARSRTHAVALGLRRSLIE